ncbi:MAG: DUF2240 family protein [Candidatus Thermoplasmatota archaeon]|nr:DUF2240 family protein [Candidatus Thermoplasmatota archaeon]MEC7256077.1 DUF2240 family protein [Candidatus Thermoplasmatota archaeon]MEC8313069.1 DUF2240 family protein [Candidatus Thermoplasmatota archaeon]MEC8353618.1 DUF2240 family protein [Candidatus Thermoplasmatota archaeon]
MTDDNQEDVRRVIAICFRGTEAMSDLDLERILSFDMEWLSPDEAEACVSQLIDKGWLTGDRDSLAPSFNPRSVTTPIGWFPRPSRLLSPSDYEKTKNGQMIVNSGDESNLTTNSEKSPPTASNGKDPRDRLSKRLAKFIARQSEIPIDEIERRAIRKQQALNYAAKWVCLALIAREQNLEMEQIIKALSG